MPTRLLALALALIPVAGSRPGVQPSPPGELAGYLALGASPDYLEAWKRPPVKGHPPRVPATKEFFIGDTAYVAFIVSGVLPDEKGEADVTIDFKLIKPDGTFMFQEEGYARVVGPATTKPYFVVADPALDIVFETGDPVGTYSLVGIFHDRVSKKGALAEVRFEVKEKRPN